MKAVGDAGRRVGRSRPRCSAAAWRAARSRRPAANRSRRTPSAARRWSRTRRCRRVAKMRPDVVVWMSLWEKSDIIADGKTLVSGTPAGDAEMLRRMDADARPRHHVRRQGRAGHHRRAGAERRAGHEQLEQRGRRRELRRASTASSGGSRRAIPTRSRSSTSRSTCARAAHRARRTSTASACAPTAATSRRPRRDRGALAHVPADEDPPGLTKPGPAHRRLIPAPVRCAGCGVGSFSWS